MAFVKITKEVEYFKMTSMKDGDVLQGYYLCTELSEKGWPNLIFDRLDGRKLSVSPAGKVRNLEKNNTLLSPGYMTRITRIGEYKDKESGRMVGNYMVEQDLEDKIKTLSDEQLAAMNVKDTSTQAAVNQMRTA